MARPKSINPCQMKGRYFRHRNPGRKYTNRSAGIVIVPSACECMVPFRNFGAEDKDLFTQTTSYGLDKKSATPGMDFHTLTTKNQMHLLVLPCGKTFLNIDSEGTKTYLNLKKRQGVKSAFKGCSSLDEKLLNENELNYDISESLGLFNDMILVHEDKSFDEEIRDQNWEVILSYLSNNSMRKELKIRHLLPIAETLGSLGKNKEDPFEALIDDPLKEEEPEDEKVVILQRALKKMTRLQRKAVNAYYLENWYKKTKLEVAKTIGISLDSLNDRLTLAEKKVRSEFQDFLKKKEKKEAPEEEKVFKTKRPPRTVFLKYTGVDGVTHLIEITKQEPRPFGPKTERPGINKEFIRQQIREEYLGAMKKFGL